MTSLTAYKKWKRNKAKTNFLLPYVENHNKYPFHAFRHYELHADITQKQNNATFFEEKEMGAVGENKQDWKVFQGHRLHISFQMSGGFGHGIKQDQWS